MTPWCEGRSRYLAQALQPMWLIVCHPAAPQMKGDYHRYLAEFKTSSDRKDAAEHTLLAYKAAQVGRPRFFYIPVSQCSSGLRSGGFIPPENVMAAAADL